MRVLILPKYGALAASTRHRFLQFLPYLAERGIECEVSPLLHDSYLEELFGTGRAGVHHAAGAFVRRVAAAMRARRFDAVILYLEAYPYLPATLSWWLSWAGIPYIYDFDDAIFHRYDGHPSRVVRWMMRNKIPGVIAGASRVFAGSSYLADYARQFNPRVDIVPTVVDLDRYPVAAVTTEERPFTIGWIGSPSTSPYLHLVREPLSEFCASRRARVVLIGAGPVDLPGVPLEYRRWTEETEIRDLAGVDVGIMPLPDTPWARGKCGFKLIQYMACGLPVVASPIGANLEIVEEGSSGLLPSDGEGWVRSFERLASDPGERARMGRRGREIVAARYSVTAVRDTIREGVTAVAAERRARQSRRTESAVIAAFGREWSRLDQAGIAGDELEEMFAFYFDIFPWESLAPDAVGFDLGCGSGRWAKLVAPRVRGLDCIDPSQDALDVARLNLAMFDNCQFHCAGADAIPLEDEYADFGYSLGVLHHLTDPAAALRNCVAKLKRGAPFLLYVYYAFDNRPSWYRTIWRATVPFRVVLSRAPFPVRYLTSQVIAATVYYPLARAARLVERAGADVTNFPLAAYRDRSLYVMRTDSLDRFGTRVEQRFTRAEVESMMTLAGLERIRFSERAFWCAVGFKT